jgi:hypothetical protein
MMEAGPFDIGWVEIASSVGFAGLAFYLIVVTGPRTLKAFSDELAAERAARDRSVDKFTESLDRERIAYDKSLDKLTAAFAHQMERHRDTVQDVVDKFTANLPKDQGPKG